MWSPAPFCACPVWDHCLHTPGAWRTQALDPGETLGLNQALDLPTEMAAQLTQTPEGAPLLGLLFPLKLMHRDHSAQTLHKIS